MREPSRCRCLSRPLEAATRATRARPRPAASPDVWGCDPRHVAFAQQNREWTSTAVAVSQRPFWFQTAFEVDPHERAGTRGLEVAFGLEALGRARRTPVASDEHPPAMSVTARPWRHRHAQTAFGDATTPPHRSWASSAAARSPSHDPLLEASGHGSASGRTTLSRARAPPVRRAARPVSPVERRAVHAHAARLGRVPPPGPRSSVHSFRPSPPRQRSRPRRSDRAAWRWAAFNGKGKEVLDVEDAPRVVKCSTGGRLPGFDGR